MGDGEAQLYFVFAFFFVFDSREEGRPPRNEWKAVLDPATQRSLETRGSQSRKVWGNTE